MVLPQVGVLFSTTAMHSADGFRQNLIRLLVAVLVIITLHFILSFRTHGSAEPKARWTWWEKLVYLGIVVSVAVLGCTSFFAVLRYGALGGWLLFAHMFGAGAFVALLPLVSVTWCEASCVARRQDSGRQVPPPRFFWIPKLMFWLVLFGGFVVTMTMLLSMLPLFGTDGLYELLDLHRYAGLLVVIALAIHVYSVLLQRLGWR